MIQLAQFFELLLCLCQLLDVPHGMMLQRHDVSQLLDVPHGMMSLSINGKCRVPHGMMSQRQS